MAPEALVRPDIEAGLNLVKALDAARFGVVAALWLFNGETETWRMVVAYEGGPEQLQDKTFEAAQVVAAWRKKAKSLPILDLGRVRITSAEDPLIKGLRPAMPLDGIGELRVTGNMVNGIYLENAVIHRLAA